MDINDLKNSITDPLDEDQQTYLLNFIEETLSVAELADKEDLLDYLSELLSKSGQSIEGKNPKLYEKLQVLWLKLAFAAFPVLPDDDQDNLLQKKIFSAIARGYNPDLLLSEFFIFFDSQEYIKELFKRFVGDLDQNTETLGSLPIDVEGKRMLPNIKYWLLDYSKFPSKVAKRGSVERLNYLTQSSNVRQLSQPQRQALSKLLKFYDDLLAAEKPLAPARETAELPKVQSAMRTQTYAPVTDSAAIDAKLDNLKHRISK